MMNRFGGKMSSDSAARSQSTPAKKTAQPAASRLLKRAKSYFKGNGTSLKHAESDCTVPQAVATSVCSAAVESPVTTSVLIVVPHKRVGFGERIAVVGHTEALGCWETSNGVLLNWGEGDVWSTTVCLPPGVHEFKCVTVKVDGRTEWEFGRNRVVQVPTSSTGSLQLLCEWSNTSSTVLTSTPASSSTASSTTGSAEPADSEVLLGGVRDSYYSCCNSISSSGSAADLEPSMQPVLMQLSGLPLVSSPVDIAHGGGGWQPQPQSGLASRKSAGGLDQQTSLAGTATGTMQSGSCDTGCVSSSEEPYAAISGKRASTAVEGTTAPTLLQLNSSGDLSMYSYEHGSGQADAAVVKQQQQQDAGAAVESQSRQNWLSSLSLGGTGTPAAPGSGSPELQSRPDSDISDQDASCIEQDESSLSAASSYAVNSCSRSLTMSSAITSPAVSGSVRPGHGLLSGSTLSCSTSMEVSEVVLEDHSSGCSMTDADGGAGGMGLGGTSSSGYLSSAAGVTAAEAALTEGLAIDLEDPTAFEELMAAEPSSLLQMSVFAAAATAEGASAEEVLEAATQLFSLAAGGPGADALATTAQHPVLFKEDTLPPEALIKFASVTSADIQEQQASAAAAAAAEGAGAASGVFRAAAAVPPQRPADLNDAVSTKLSKDQLPCLGLTVTVPTPADKAAQAAAELKAANREAAAVKAAVGKVARISSDGSAVEVPVAREGLRLLAAAHIIPHVDKTHTGGEDAYFVSSAGHGAIGVSDGVSAWAEDGIDPGEYSRTLVQYCSEAIEERAIAAARAANKGAFVAKFDPRSVLRYAQQCTCKPGSATVVLAALQPQGKLHVANLGDCGVKVVRDGKVLFETQPQQHDFNLPYQLSHPRLFPDTDTADSADRYTWDVREGDVIVAASDGLFDNLWDDEMVELLQQALLGIPPRSAMDPAGSDSLGKAAGKKMSRSRSFAALSRSFGGHGSSSSSHTIALPSVASAPAMAAAAAGAGGSTCGAASSHAMSRSRSTSHLSNWTAKQLWSWKNKAGSSAGGKAAAGVAAASGGAGYSTLTEESVVDGPPGPGVAADAAVESAVSAPAAVNVLPSPLPVLTTPAAVGPAAVQKAAELLAAAAAAHAADKEFKSPWSVAAGKAYGLLARLFAKGGKMDDITCVVAVVQDAQANKPAGIAPSLAAPTAGNS